MRSYFIRISEGLALRHGWRRCLLNKSVLFYVDLLLLLLLWPATSKTCEQQ